MSEPRESTPPPHHQDVARLIGAVDVRAPERLHEHVRTMVAPRERSSRDELRARLRPTLAAMAAAAVAGVAIALLSGGGGTQALNVRDASALTLGTATSGAPRELSAHSGELNIAADGVPFPYWKERFGWRSTGARTDTLGGHRVTTVFYAGPDGRRIGYAIVAGTPPAGLLTSLRTAGQVSWHGGVSYRLLHQNGTPVVVWQRDGRLCVLSGRNVDGATLLRLASWGEGRQAT